MSTSVGSRRASVIGRMALICVALMVTSCPDPEGTYDEWLDTTADMRVSGDASVDGGQHVDFSGNYMLSAMTPVGGPLNFSVEVVVHDGLTLIDMTFQPLKTDFPFGSTDPRPDAREPIGDPIIATDVVYNDDGTWEAPMGVINVAGDANPITGRDIVADLTFVGTVLAEDAFCGIATGQVIDPIDLDLAGSTFAAVATDDPTTVVDPPVECPGDDSGDE